MGSTVSPALASPLQFERVPSLDNRIPLLVQDRVPNPCLTKANDTCIFPFTYNGVEYYRCTYADSPTPWSTRRATMSLARDNMDSALQRATQNSGGSREKRLI